MDLGLSPEEFWRMQPYLFFVMEERLISRLETEDMRSAQIVCALANIHRDPKKRRKPYPITDFLPQRRKKAGTKKKEVQPWKAQLQMAMMLHLAFGGDPKNLPKTGNP